MQGRRQSMEVFDEGVTIVKKIKMHNDGWKKKIGMGHTISEWGDFKGEANMMKGEIQKVQKIIENLEKSYVDPNTSRRIGVLQTQLKLQKDRMSQLLNEIKTETTQPKQKSPKASLHNFELQKKNNCGNPHQYIKQSQRYEPFQNQVTMETDIDFQIERRLLSQRNQQIKDAEKKMNSILAVVKETDGLVNFQGEKINIIGEEIFTTYSQIGEANQQLNQASKQQKKSNCRRTIFLVLFLVSLIIISFCYLQLM